MSDALDQGQGSRDLLLRVHRRTVGDARLAPDIDHVGARLEQRAGELDPLLERSPNASIRERVRGGVDNAHQPWPPAERKRS